MGIKKVIPFFIFLSLMVCSYSAMADDQFQEYDNFPYRSIDNGFIVIAPNNNNSLCKYFNYEFYIVDKGYHNLTIKVNETVIGFKNKTVDIFFERFYLNNSISTLDFFATYISSTVLCSLMYLTPNPTKNNENIVKNIANTTFCIIMNILMDLGGTGLFSSMISSIGGLSFLLIGILPPTE